VRGSWRDSVAYQARGDTKEKRDWTDTKQKIKACVRQRKTIQTRREPVSCGSGFNLRGAQLVWRPFLRTYTYLLLSPRDLFEQRSRGTLESITVLINLRKSFFFFPFWEIFSFSFYIPTTMILLENEKSNGPHYMSSRLDQ
jgi:hypothetical protein